MVKVEFWNNYFGIDMETRRVAVVECCEIREQGDLWEYAMGTT